MRTWLLKWWPRLRKGWPWLKALLIVALLAWIGREFARDLGKDPHLLERTLRPGWLALSGLLYLAGLAFSALYWDRLLRHLGQRPPATATLRAYYLGHLGKYAPGKAWSLLMRVGMARTAGVRVGVAVMTTFYEVLATMSSGALLAAALFLLLAPAGGPDWDNLLRLATFRDPEPETAPLDRWVLALLALLVLAPAVGPILPPVFNRLVDRLTRRFRQADAALLPLVGWRPLAEGLAGVAVGWLV
ncbi:MAG TPA: lysylphosphatidylglycerol synthase domain-containing protein, partial [Gemmataceae bacterium]|nr:lysylphosphatidylglycerol synthase domain-containing protein [Gemmataceae bacterium]